AVVTAVNVKPETVAKSAVFKEAPKTHHKISHPVAAERDFSATMDKFQSQIIFLLPGALVGCVQFVPWHFGQFHQHALHAAVQTHHEDAARIRHADLLNLARHQ